MSDEAEQFARRFDVSRETLSKLRTYEALLRAWTGRINIVSPASLNHFWTRHVADSAQLHSLAGAGPAWVDIGSGGGFPGLVLALLGQRVTLIESDLRKAEFLRTVVRATGAACEVLSQRSEAVPPMCANVVTARGVAPLDRLLGLVERHLAPDGVALLPKGGNVDGEVTRALARWRFRCEKIPSVTRSDAVILRISDISLA